MNNSEPYVKLDEDAYIIMPKGAQFSDASYKKTESAKGKKKVASIACVIHADVGDIGFFAREHYRSYGHFKTVSEKWCPADNQYINYN